MEILAHRGAWTAPHERNTLAALERAWRRGHGVETDLRDLDGEVVVSHDPPRSSDRHGFSFSALLESWTALGRPGRLALNIKSDGLAPAVAQSLESADAVERAFVFDMAVPDQLAYDRAGVPLLTRWSEIEAPVWSPGARGLWLDAFTDDTWWDEAEVRTQLERGRQVVLVSPELHGREHAATWARVRAAQLHLHTGFALCTDHPDEAEEFFA